MLTRIKICGITRVEDAIAAAAAGASAVGFIFADSPRRAEPKVAREAIRRLPPYVAAVGVFVDESPARIRELSQELHLTQVQLHGSEDPAAYSDLPGSLTKAIAVDGTDLDATLERWQQHRQDCRFLIDLPKGDEARVAAPDWKVQKELARRVPLTLAGGLNADNLFAALSFVRPAAVDLSRGVEVAPGIKDPALIQVVCQIVQSFDATDGGVCS